ncbi:MAG: RNA polymerase sigma factor [Cyclobacteriaceae bacterium]|nr:RNA polymerase sigma factor [Cyclobacteriaceae bacterium HetDA_MAG_MS6]
MHFSDEELIEGCCKQDRHMQQCLYNKYSGSMYAIALRYAKMQQEAEDILQEAFLKVFQNIENFRKDSSLPYWIKRIVVNTALNHQRGKLYLYPMVDVAELRNNAGQNMTLSAFSHAELLQMIQELPDGCRIIFNLYAIEGYKHHEIATMLDISEGTSKSQYARAKSLLQDKIEENNQISYEQSGKINGGI